MNTNSAPLPENNTDHIIDRALSTLRDATPRAGLNNRVLASLEHRSAHATNHARTHSTNPGGPSFHGGIVKGPGSPASSARWGGAWGIARGSARENGSDTARLVLWPALAACLIAVATITILHHHTAPTDLAHSTPQSPVSPKIRVPQVRGPQRPQSLGWHVSILRPGIDSPRSPMERTLSTTRHPEQSAAARRTPVFVSCPDHQPTGCPIHEDNVVMGGVITTSPDPDAQALADLHTPSYPAPPLPLTTQEKLFLRMFRDTNATELAELNPIVRAQQDAAETTDFKTFFPDPPPLHQPGDDE